MQAISSDEAFIEEISRMVKIIDQVASPDSPFANNRSHAIAKELIKSGILQKAGRRAPTTEKERKDYIERLVWWIEHPERMREKKKRRRRRPPA